MLRGKAIGGHNWVFRGGGGLLLSIYTSPTYYTSEQSEAIRLHKLT